MESSAPLQATLPTVLNYLAALESAWLVRRVGRLDLQGRKHLEFHDKFYAGDIGLRNSLVGYPVHTGQQAGLEIDFVAERAQERLYIQVCYMLSDPKTGEREFRSLDKIDDHHPKLVLSLDAHWEGNQKGIGWKNLITWLAAG